MFAVIGFRGRLAAATTTTNRHVATALLQPAPPSSSSSPSSTSPQRRHFSLRAKQRDLVIPGTYMPLPRTPGQRHARLPDLKDLYTGDPVEHLTCRLKNHAGRNITGRITVRGRGGGGKRIYRIVDFRRNSPKYLDKPARVERIEFDPNRSANIALVKYANEKLHENQQLSYIIAPDGLQEGDTVMSSKDKELEMLPGNAMPLKLIPVGKTVHNVENKPGAGGVYARSAGTFLTIMDKNTKKANYVQVEMNSKEQRLLHESCMATIGRVSFPNHQFINLGKAGRRRNMGRRPKVRGVAMNAVDHPHGGGEGKSKGGRPSVSKWGKSAKGARTRNTYQASQKLIVKRRPMNKKRYKTDETDATLTSKERTKAEMLSKQPKKKGGQQTKKK